MRGGQWQALYLMRGLIAAGHRARLLAPAGSPLMNAAAAQQVDAQPVGIGGCCGRLRAWIWFTPTMRARTPWL